MLVTALLGTLVGLAVPLIARQVIDGPIAAGDRSALLPLALLAVAFGVAEALLILIRRWATANSSLGMENDLRNDLYRHLQRLPVAFHDKWQSGQLLSRATTDLAIIRRFVGFAAVFIITDTLTFLVIAIMLLVMYWPLGVVTLVSGIPLVIFMLHHERIYKVLARRVQDQTGELTTAVEEAAVGIRIIKSFGRRQMFYDGYDEQARTVRGQQLDKIRTLAKIWSVLDAYPQIVLAVVVLIGSIGVAKGAVTLGTLAAFAALYLAAIWPIAALGWLLANAQDAAAAGDRLMEVLDTPTTIVESERPSRIEHPRGQIRLEGVGFAYHDAPDAPVLRDVNLTIESGETLAVVGATGSGKTTLTALVPRLYDVTAGRITIDGVDVRDLAIADLRTIVATAFEEPTLFSASVRENLTLGRPQATDAEVAEALSVAHAEFVHRLPWGLDTRIGEQGLSLSGGQRQRLALARAILGRPRVLVLDDPLSALDVHTEELVETALRSVLNQTTGLVVAHRASTVLLADRVALMEDGTITATGTHQELLETVPAYREILSQEAELDSDLDPV
ncbi:ABC transporter ATP-binding protein [Kribbella speibonae]|uniref:ABC transporter ATP-binding protein n=2 Tax=Kribbella speibonae TaxID=1572660 RepID=A0A4R0ITR6_9ACTN|nr:ABC transporter ATP-binding protein [Kribbella speibonae]